MEPEATMMSYHLTCLYVYDLSFLLAHKLAQEIVVINLSEETDTLTVLAACAGQFCIQGYLANLLLHQMTDGEDGMA